MAFGNPYGDEYSSTVVLEHMERLNQNGFSHFALADTVGLATPNRSYGTGKTSFDTIFKM